MLLINFEILYIFWGKEKKRVYCIRIIAWVLKKVHYKPVSSFYINKCK